MTVLKASLAGHWEIEWSIQSQPREQSLSRKEDNGVSARMLPEP